MCLNPIKIRNPRVATDSLGRSRVAFSKYSTELPSSMYVPCRRCDDCIKKRLLDYRNRTKYEILSSRDTHIGLLVTLSFAQDSGFFDGDLIANMSQSIRDFSESLRLKYGTFKRVFIPEFGTKRGRVHLHGILFFDKDNEKQMDLYNEILSHKVYHRSLKSGFFSPVLSSIWRFGLVHVGEDVSAKTANYISKYFTKESTTLRGKPLMIYCSNNFGKLLDSIPFELYQQIYDYFDNLLSDDGLSHFESVVNSGGNPFISFTFRHEYDEDGVVYFNDYNIKFDDFILLLKDKLNCSTRVIDYFLVRYGYFLDLLEHYNYLKTINNPLLCKTSYIKQLHFNDCRKKYIHPLFGIQYYVDSGTPSVLRDSESVKEFFAKNIVL